MTDKNFHFRLRKDGFVRSKPWMVDIVWHDNKPMWLSWSGPFKTRKAAVQHCEAVDSAAQITSAT